VINNYDILIIGGGAAGFFTAINAAQLNPDATIAILERGKDVLTKVKISGGGRCNVTHAEFEPKPLTAFYPRGEKELLGPFHSFMTGDTIAWFEERGVPLKIEDDGRMFPVSDSSQSIIDCFASEVNRLEISVLKGHAIKSIRSKENTWEVATSTETFTATQLVVATGSNPKVWKMLEGLGHRIIPPVPSLFTFNINDVRIKDLPGLSTEAQVTVLAEDGSLRNELSSEGPLLITHWGMSGPAILKLSAWGARLLEPTKYVFKIQVNWLLDASEEDVVGNLLELKEVNPRQSLQKFPQFELPKRLWRSLLVASEIPTTETWATVTKNQLKKLSQQLVACEFQVKGKSTFKEEFVTAGGLDLKEVNFKNFESRLHPNLFFAGEVLNIDAITGGFNFQNAWTGGYLVAQALSKTQ